MLTVTRIAPDGSMRRRNVDTDGRGDAWRWESLVGRAPAFPPAYQAAPGDAVYHVSVNDHVILVGEHDLAGPLRDLVAAVLAEGGAGEDIPLPVPPRR
jgi:hypothetical protein